MKCYHCPHKKEINIRSNDNWEKVCSWACGANKNELIAVNVEAFDERHIFSPSWCPEKAKKYTIDDLRVAFEEGYKDHSNNFYDGYDNGGPQFYTWFEEWNKNKSS